MHACVRGKSTGKRQTPGQQEIKERPILLAFGCLVFFRFWFWCVLVFCSRVFLFVFLALSSRCLSCSGLFFCPFFLFGTLFSSMEKRARASRGREIAPTGARDTLVRADYRVVGLRNCCCYCCYLQATVIYLVDQPKATMCCCCCTFACMGETYHLIIVRFAKHKHLREVNLPDFGPSAPPAQGFVEEQHR